LSQGKRDDEALYQTLNNIYSSFWWSVSCKCPVEPFDDLLSNLDTNQIQKFKTALNDLRTATQQALNTYDSQLAISYLSKHLGNKFQ
jgi:hypothetical protein